VARPLNGFRIAASAKANCPLSKVIKADISLDATLK